MESEHCAAELRVYAQMRRAARRTIRRSALNPSNGPICSTRGRRVTGRPQRAVSERRVFLGRDCARANVGPRTILSPVGLPESSSAILAMGSRLLPAQRVPACPRWCDPQLPPALLVSAGDNFLRLSVDSVHRAREGSETPGAPRRTMHDLTYNDLVVRLQHVVHFFFPPRVIK